MKVVEFELKYSMSMAYMLDEHFKEVHGNDYVGDVDKALRSLSYLTNYYTFYILLDNYKPIGFMTMSYNDRHGMVKPYVQVEDQYIKPPYRNGMAIFYLLEKVGEISTRLGCDVYATTSVNSSSKTNAFKVGAETVAVLTKTTLDKIIPRYNKYKSRIKNENI